MLISSIWIIGFVKKNSKRKKFSNQYFDSEDGFVDLPGVSQEEYPSVYITLAEFRPNALKVLRDHNNALPLESFAKDYEKSFGPFLKAKKGGDCSKTYVPLEHLLHSIPGVEIERSLEGTPSVKLLVSTPKGERSFFRF